MSVTRTKTLVASRDSTTSISGSLSDPLHQCLPSGYFREAAALATARGNWGQI
jgi:hypothetical protein